MKKAMIVILASMSAAGCATLPERARGQARRGAVEPEDLKLEMAEISKAVRGLDTAQQGIYAELDALKAKHESDSNSMDARLRRIEEAVSALDAARVKDREEIIRGISSRVADKLKVETGPRLERGREHVVKAGETLSAIAAAYGVKPDRIVKANALSDPDSLKVGQKLFIPGD